MKKNFVIVLVGTSFLLAALLSSYRSGSNRYPVAYQHYLDTLADQLTRLQQTIRSGKSTHDPSIRVRIEKSRAALKACDFWLRYTGPEQYKKLNGPLPVEWETEVFEKYEPPYKRTGAGLSLATQYLASGGAGKDSLLNLINEAAKALPFYYSDSVLQAMQQFGHFYLCNRLFLLNLASIYTTSFECPDKSRVVPELVEMLQAVEPVYEAFSADFPAYRLPGNYLRLFHQTIAFVKQQPGDLSQFDHFSFTRDFINPLFSMNQQYLRQYKVHSTSAVDYTLSAAVNSIFDKNLYWAQNGKGVYSGITDPVITEAIDSVGKLLFFDPVLSGNGQRSCASCHKPGNYFTDTATSTAVQFNHTGHLSRNTPSLVNVIYNHLLHADGKFLSLQDQALGVMTNPLEMGNDPEKIVANVLSCEGYKKFFQGLIRYTKQKESIQLSHITSAITFYYSKFSGYPAPFDEAMDHQRQLNPDAVQGFNVFMGKAQCGTCHFAPLFNGIKPPYDNNEFEVIGVPSDTNFTHLATDSGRYSTWSAPETRNAFRTPALRNLAFTKPYMHNGVFNTLEQVIDFYDAGGGIGKKMEVPNQTLSADSLHLTAIEKKQLLAFINSLNEPGISDTAPARLPASNKKALAHRRVGGEY